MVMEESYVMDHSSDELTDRIIFVSNEEKSPMTDKSDAA